MMGIQGLVNASAPPDYQAGGAPAALDGFHNHFQLMNVQLQQVSSGLRSCACGNGQCC